MVSEYRNWLTYVLEVKQKKESILNQEALTAACFTEFSRWPGLKSGPGNERRCLHANN